MSKTGKAKPKITGYLGFVYGGLLKQGYTHVFCIDADSEQDVETTFENFKKYYGDKLHGRFVDLTNGDAEENLEKFFKNDKISNLRMGNYMLMEATMMNLIKVIKEVAGVDKAHMLGFDDDDDDKAQPVPQKTQSKQPTKATNKATKQKEEVVEDDNDKEDNAEEDAEEAVSDAEAEEEPKKEVKPAKKTVAKKPAEKPKGVIVVKKKKSGGK